MRVKLSVLDRFIAARVEKHWRLFLAMSAADAAKILEVSEDASPEELKKPTSVTMSPRPSSGPLPSRISSTIESLLLGMPKRLKESIAEN